VVVLGFIVWGLTAGEFLFVGLEGNFCFQVTSQSCGIKPG